MKIAQISPLYESVPPKYYGGTERIISYLTEELVRQGHDVTLFASGDSITKAKLYAVNKKSLRLDKNCVDQLAHHILLIEKAFQQKNKFDIIHSHVDYLPFPLIRHNPDLPSLTTLHGQLTLPDLVPLYKEFKDIPVTSISYSQRKPLPWINWRANVYHGLPEDLYKPYEKPGRYLAFLGRISPEKRLDTAIEIAKQAQIPLKVAAKIDKKDAVYFQKKIRPLLSHYLVEYIGEIGEKQKNKFLGEALALIFPIDWPEPFGLVMAESLACGTPVITHRRGSVPEIIEEGVSGFIVKDVREAVKAVKKVSSLSRKRCRAVFEKRFTASRMARDYVQVYKNLIAEKS